MGKKKYFWLKIPDDFFRDKKIKKLRKFAGGDTLIVIYIKLMLYSISNGGIIEYSFIEDSLEDEIALSLDEVVDNVKILLAYLRKVELFVEKDDNNYAVTQAVKLLSFESHSAAKMRKSRAKKEVDASQCDGEIQIHKHKHIEHTYINTHTEIKNCVCRLNELYKISISQNKMAELVNKKGIDTVKKCIVEYKKYITYAKNKVGMFTDFTLKYGTPDAYTSLDNTYSKKPIQATNYEQREYDDEFFNSLYDNVELYKKE